ncbi:RdgB/HAM1 family non-canonical purine NTP pyrophosphatase [Gammaproteobacteria bacterium]|nr:RdgB/HAM1 family non-canonical purine NTP pyrophosphatase [Gammaproteobacteria bacterium]
MEWVFASSNPGKFLETATMLEPFGIKLIPQASLGIRSVFESGLSYAENALLKARNAAQIAKKPALADDSGLEVEALDQQPGLYSARYCHLEPMFSGNIEKVLTLMQEQTNRKARLISVMALLQHEHDTLPELFTGIWEGEILHEQRGRGGFGYDPIFYDPNLKKTGAQMSVTQKNLISHRGQSLDRLRAYLTDMIGQ